MFLFSASAMRQTLAPERLLVVPSPTASDVLSPIPQASKLVKLPRRLEARVAPVLQDEPLGPEALSSPWELCSSWFVVGFRVIEILEEQNIILLVLAFE